MTKTQANEPGFVLANEAKPDPRIAPLAKAMEAKRAELIGQPLSFIWDDLARVALAAAPIVPAPAYGVKALEWEHHRDAPNHARASSEFGAYRIKGNKDGACWGCRSEGHLLQHDAASIEEAKAAAQADFERRILSCLSSAPVEEADAKAGEPGDAETAVAVALQLAMVLEDCEVWVNAAGRSLSARMNGPAMAQTIRDVALYAAPPAPTIPSEPEAEAKGEAGAGPVGEATIVGFYTIRQLLRGEQIQHGGLLLIPASDIMDGSCGSPEYHSEKAAREWATAKWHEEVANRPLRNFHRRTLDTTWRQVIRQFGGDDEKLCGPRHDDLAAARPVEEPSEVERITRERDEARMEAHRNKDNATHWMGKAIDEGIHATVKREELKAALAETQKLLREVRDTGLIYWEPNTSRGGVEKGKMLQRIDAALSTQENSAALAGDGKEAAR